MTTQSSPKIAVIGAGITGVTTAYMLARKGAQVTLFEANPYPAMETSYANGGQLSASNAEVWNSVPTVLKGMKWMFKSGAPLLLNPKPSWHKYSWLAEFVGAIPKYRENTIQTVKWALEARAHLRTISEDEGIDFDREERGILHFYGSKGEFDTAAKVTTLLAEGGLERHAVTPAEIEQIEPALKGDIYGGFFTESDFTGDIHKFTSALAKGCAKRGVTLRMSTFVTKVDAAQGKIAISSQPAQGKHEKKGGVLTEIYDKVVICSGVKSRSFAAHLGDRLNIYPVKGYSLTINLEDEAAQTAAPTVSLLDDNAKIVTSRLGKSRFRVAGTAEFNGYNKDIVWNRVAPMLDWCHTHFPEMSTESFQSWAGLRPMMPNVLPRVGQGRNPAVFYNTGHGHLGWTLSAATAEIVSELAIA
ncbi:D-amino acid dehydrogenase [Sulfitobacter sp. S223]|uniref:D-amino acid dehydrogenase n=1 Tax=Sulfitobacter sp. S223 TaxID=2867023 RepID=UPI0021A83AC7|nr:D-amino acid dehydrogenase [Sulfitobacter sp. S223]UWR25475.1 D-amino acid dehydrogenase [Sulfitobacter sp. S223]